MSNKTVSIIIVYRRIDYVESCLASLKGQAGEILVIDNSLNFSFSQSLQARHPGIRWFVQQENLSYGAALNLGIRESRGEFVLCLNDDVVLSPDYIERCLDGFSRGPRVGMVSGKITRSDKSILDSTGLFLSFCYTARERGYGKKDTGQVEREGAVFGVTGAAGFYRRDMLEDIKEKGFCFDPAFGYFYEDLDVAWRAHRRGWTGYYIPGAGAAHVRGGTARQTIGIGRRGARMYLSDELHACLIKNRYAMICKNATVLGFLGRLPFMIFYDAISWGYIFLFRPRVARLLFSSCQKNHIGLP